MKNDKHRQLMLLELGIGNIKTFNKKFVSYNTKFLGVSSSDNFIINGESTRNAKSLNEFCYGYDKMYEELHILNVFETTSGIRFAAAEIAMSVYAFWEISNN